jgi:hypothetical protein
MYMRGMRNGALAALAALVVACASDTTNPSSAGGRGSLVHAGDTVILRPGQVVNVGSESVQLAFRQITEDSRCPNNAVCVWQGNAEAVLEARMGLSAWKRLAINSHVEPRAAEYGAYRFQLVEVAPPQETSRTIEPSDYRVRIAVSTR